MSEERKYFIEHTKKVIETYGAEEASKILAKIVSANMCSDGAFEWFNEQFEKYI